MKKQDNKRSDDLRHEYNLREPLKGAVRGKYSKAYHAGTNLVLLDPDVRKAFDSERDVNEALRLVLQLRKAGAKRTRAGTRRGA